MMRFFQKAVRRANIDICYSEGFSPHQIMSFAAPLGVGITSDGEYFDIEVNSTLTSKEALLAFNNQMVDGVEVTGYVKLPDNAKTAMSIVEAADYNLYYKDGYNSPLNVLEWEEMINKHFLSQKEFMVVKKTKKSEKEIDLKPLVYDIKVKSKDDRPYFYIKVSTGSVNNIKPDFVLDSIYKKCDLEYNPLSIQIHRNDVYALDSNNNFVSLLDLGEEI